MKKKYEEMLDIFSFIMSAFLCVASLHQSNMIAAIPWGIIAISKLIDVIVNSLND